MTFKNEILTIQLQMTLKGRDALVQDEYKGVTQTLQDNVSRAGASRSQG